MRRKEREDRLVDLFACMTADLESAAVAALPCSPLAFAIARLKERMRKRAEFHRPEHRRTATEGFVARNARMRAFQHKLTPEEVYYAKVFITHVLEKYTRKLDESSLQDTLSWPIFLDAWRFGPGASTEVPGSHAVHKYLEDWTVTDNAEPLVRILRRCTNHLRLLDESRGGGVRTVQGSKLSFVLKNEDEVRAIAIEPSGNMALQLAAETYLRGALATIGLNIEEQQPLNKALAQRGSIDGSIATIDLKAASDSGSESLYSALFDHRWMSLLTQIRTPRIKIDGAFETLHIFSTMGNGFTFPLMTLSLVALVYVNRLLRHEGPWNFVDWHDTAVFGDDIIVPVDEYSTLTDLLERAGFAVNHAKSYSQGSFRESCGGDYYDGVDVTPIYVRSLARLSDIYSTYNKVLDWSADHYPLYRTLRLLRSWMPELPCEVPEWSNPDEGIRLASVPRRYRRYVILRSEVSTYDANAPWFNLCSVPLLAGGYLSVDYFWERDDEHPLGRRERSGPDLLFTPRSGRAQWGIRNSRLPHGWLDGRCVREYTSAQSRSRELIHGLV